MTTDEEIMESVRLLRKRLHEIFSEEDIALIKRLDKEEAVEYILRAIPRYERPHAVLVAMYFRDNPEEYRDDNL